MTDGDWMRNAIELARAGMAAGQTPFGACIVKAGQVVAAAHNEVWAATDSTAHAEIVAIRRACLALGAINLAGCTIYSTCEPCPMCFAACHWAKLDRIVYGAAIAHAAAAGFHELSISNQLMKEQGQSPIQITAGVLAEECASLFAAWRGRTY